MHSRADPEAPALAPAGADADAAGSHAAPRSHHSLHHGAPGHSAGQDPADGIQQLQQQHQIVDDDPCGHRHFSHRAPWLRAMVLGANDGLVSVAALMVGVSGGDAGGCITHCLQLYVW